MELDGWTWNEIDGWHQYESEGVTPSAPLVVGVRADLDDDTGLITWSIQCMNPDTGFSVEDGYFPEDAYAGFLPPNKEAIFYADPDDPDRMIHPGEGYLSYSIQPVAGLPTGAEIRNKASIVFDWNAPIETPEVLNAIDAGAPISEVAGLPATTGQSSFAVAWSGEDDLGGCGIESYSVYVSHNGGLYRQWLTTEETSATFTTTGMGGTYSFYSIARDHVGNVEAPPTDGSGTIIPDATITVLIGDLDNDGDVDQDDVRAFIACSEGPAVPPPPGCEGDDFDLDGDVDVGDFAILQRCYSGPNNPADPDCAE